MTEFLICRLHGPLASWGGEAVGERRPTEGHPTKSAVLGLMGAALGIRRDADDVWRQLVADLGYAVRVEAAGTLLTDYHTAEWPEAWKRKGWRDQRKEKAKRHAWSRAREIDIERHALTTTQSWRDYRQDVWAWVALWERGDAAYPLADIGAALASPRFVLSLGRKSCPLALPLSPHLVTAADPVEALRAADVGPDEAEFLADLGLDTLRGSGRIYWEDDFAGLDAGETRLRRDVPVSRVRWQFAGRTEHVASAVEDGDVS